jgi:acyl carrier protein
MDDALSIPDPFVNKPGARIYRTGHLGRWRSDGSIEWLGHADQQVEIRGYRIRLKEIESALLLLPEVRAAVVMAHDDQAASKRLVAYVVGHGDRHAEPRRLREALQCKLPQHMVPRHFVMLERLPLAPNGKVDTNALPPPEEDRSPTANIAARTRQRLADIWADVLGVEEVGLHDDFFDLGGYSVSVLVLQDCIRKAFGVELTVRTLFENTRLEQLAEQVNECLGVRFSSSSGTP